MVCFAIVCWVPACKKGNVEYHRIDCLSTESLFSGGGRTMFALREHFLGEGLLKLVGQTPCTSVH